MQLAGSSGSSALAPRMAGVPGMYASTRRVRQVVDKDRLTRKPVGSCVWHTFPPLANSSQTSLPITHRNLSTTQDYMGMTSGAEEWMDCAGMQALQRLQSHDALHVSAINMLSRRKCCPTGCLPPFTLNSHPHIKPCSASPHYPHDSGHFQPLCEHPREQQNLLVL